MKKLLGLVFAFVLVFSGITPASAALKINLGTNPITLPDRTNPEDCSYTTVSVKRSDKKAFGNGSSLTIDTSIEEGEASPNQALQVTGERGLFTIRTAYATPKTVHLAVRLCTSELPEHDPSYLWAFVQLKNSNGVKIAASKVKIPIKAPTATTIAAKNFISQCAFNPDSPTFGTNFVVQVTKLQLIYDYYTERLIGAAVELKGTLIRRGLLGDKEKISIIPSGETKAIKTTTTDAKGQFKISFNAASSGIMSNGDSFGISVGSKVRQVGDQRIIEPGASDWISFDWLLTPGISKLPKSNWTPEFSQDCVDAYANFADNKDDKNRGRHVLYSAAMKLWGTTQASKSASPSTTSTSSMAPNSSAIYKEKVSDTKSYKKSFTAGGGGGGGVGKCYVSGYVTRSGKRVSGYWRSC